MQLSQLTLEPHNLSTSCVLTLAFSTLLFSLEYLRLLLSTRRRGGLHQRTRRFLGVVSQPTSLWRPILHVFIYASTFLELILDSVVYMRDLILAHI
jgi:hypothetical protein